jgi:MFS family permease
VFRAAVARLSVVKTEQGPHLITTSYQGVYPPFSVVPPGLAARFGHSPQSSLMLARIAAAVIAALLLTPAIFATGSGLPLAGLALAVTPITLFLGGTISPSGVETCGALALVAALTALSRPTPARIAWIALFAGGLALVGARPLGPVWLALAVGGFAVANVGRVRPVLQRRPRWATWAAGVVLLLGAANLAWILLRVPNPPAPLRRLWLGVQIPLILKELVGVLGWVNTPLPAAVYDLWWALVVLAVVAAVVVGTARQRLLLVGLVAGLGVVIVVVAAVFAFGQPDTRAQGRWFLPVAVALPIMAMEILTRRLTSIPARRAGALTVVPVAGCQLVAFLTNAHRYGVGHLAVTYDLHAATWHPHGGWTLWLAVGTLACLLLAISGLDTQRPTPGLREQSEISIP